MNYDEIANRCKLLEKFEENVTNDTDKDPNQHSGKPRFLKYIIWPLLTIVIIVIIAVVLYFFYFKKEEDQNSETNIETQEQAFQTEEKLFDVEQLDFVSDETSSDLESNFTNPLYSFPANQSEDQ